MRVPCLSFALLLGATPVLADNLGGQELFRRHCASCHGLGAQGDGPMAQVMTLPMPDLTALTAGQGGSFPLIRVIEILEGRAELRGHGGAMPVFAYTLAGDSVALDGPGDTVIETRADVLAIAAWLQVIQQ